MTASAAAERKSADRLAYEHHLRTGQRLTTSEWRERSEAKFNPNHDPDDGRFTTGPGGVGLGKHRQRGSSAGKGHPMSPSEVAARARRAMKVYDAEIARGKTPFEAAAWAATADAESFSNPQQHQQPSGPGRGLFQWGANDASDRRVTFQKIMGVPIEKSTMDQQLSFRYWELNNTHEAAKHAIDRADSVSEIVRAITNYYTKPRDRIGSTRDRANIAKAILLIPNILRK